MEKLTSIENFNVLQDRLYADRDLRKPVIVVSAGTCGQASGANDLIRILKRELLANKLTDRIGLRITGCQGFCNAEPSLLVEPRGTFYPNVKVADVPRIVAATASDSVVEDLLFADAETGQRQGVQREIPFFQKQVRTIMAHSEKIDPIRIFDYIANGGYVALVKILARNDPASVVAEVKASGLRGRGGAGFPTGLKWEFLAKRPSAKGKFLVCNGDEGDPGAYMDRSVLEGNPHSVIEGMLIGGFATGANKGVFYVRAEYPLAIKHLTIALRQARDLGFLGEHILGTNFSFDIKLVRGAGAFVCGEETALIHSIEGKMGEPRQRPPFPVDRGINGHPTAINNVETWANIPGIINEGAAAYARIGTKGNTGTKIFSLVGKIKNTGLVEVPMGITINEIVHEIGGGPSGSAPIKAVQTGGPSGGCIPAEKFDLPIDYDSLTAAGSIMGSGGMIVMDENTCMVDVAKYFMNFLKSESCGKCFTCRKGTQRMYEILEDICEGKATLDDLNTLEELATTVRDTTMCGLGNTAGNPVLSTLRYFRNEYLRHIEDKRCDAFVCKGLVGAACQSACPLGTEAWRYTAHIARGEYEDAYRVIREKIPMPSICARVCNHPCEARCKAGGAGGKPVNIRALKRFITDRFEPKPVKAPKLNEKLGRVAIIGAGPAGLSAAHYLRQAGHPVTIYENNEVAGGMLTAGIPEFRLPRAVLKKEIDALLTDGITLKTNERLGRDITIDGLLKDGFKSVFIATGAHKSRRLGLAGEDSKGVYAGMQFLSAFNLKGEQLAKGKVAVVGGGNSAIDAARVAIRQKDVKEVVLLYRRTRHEMPAFEEEIEAALEEGIKLETLVSPVALQTKNGAISSLTLQRNQLGERDADGRRKPVPVPGTETTLAVDTLIVAISESPDTSCVVEGVSQPLAAQKDGRLQSDAKTLLTSRPGVFAGGDVVTGPNTVVNAMATGRQAAEVIHRYLTGKPLEIPASLRRPEAFLPPLDGEAAKPAERANPPALSPAQRSHSFAEVESGLSEEQARCEARRCLRCDLEFTQPQEDESCATCNTRRQPA